MRIHLVEDNEEQIQIALAAIHAQFLGSKMLGQKKNPAFADWSDRYVSCSSQGDVVCDVNVSEDMQTGFIY